MIRRFLASKRDLEKKEAVTQLQLKKLKTETKASNSFSFKGNKVQFEFNTRLFGAVEAASKNILLKEITRQRIIELERAKTLISKSDKFIRFVDNSPAGCTAGGRNMNQTNSQKISITKRNSALLKDEKSSN